MPAPKYQENQGEDGPKVSAYNARTTLTFDDFSAGEFGAQSPWNAKPNSFTGLNVVRYADGSLGPRNGLKQITLSGATPASINSWGRLLVSADNLVWLIGGSTMYVFNPTTGLVTSCGVVTTPTEPAQGVPKGTKTYVTIIGDSYYVVDHTAGTVAANAIYAAGPPESGGRPGLRCIAQYGVRTLAGGAVPAAGTPLGKAPDGTTAPGNRLYFSAPGDPTAWPAANFIDIGDTSLDITAIVPQRTHCLIATSDGSWWILTGVPGVNPVLRTALGGVSPAYPEHAAQIGSGNVAYVIGSSTDNGSVESLGEFTGSQVSLYQDIPFGSGRRTAPLPTYTVVPLKDPNDWFCQGGSGVAVNSMALNQRGTWSLHQWQVSGVTLLGLALGNLPGIDQELFTDGTHIYQWRAYNNRPAFAGDSFMQPGDATAATSLVAHFSLPEWSDTGKDGWGGGGREIAVESIIIDFAEWNTGAAQSNHFDVGVTTLRPYEGSDISTSFGSYDNATMTGLSTSTPGTRRRRRFDAAGTPQGNAFQVNITNLRGISIQKIIVEVSLTGHRPFRQYDGQRD